MATGEARPIVHLEVLARRLIKYNGTVSTHNGLFSLQIILHQMLNLPKLSTQIKDRRSDRASTGSGCSQVKPPKKNRAFTEDANGLYMPPFKK